MDKEALKQINEILKKDIDPIFIDIAKKIAPRITNPRYMPWLLAHKMDAKGAKILYSLPDENWTPELGKFGVSDAFAKRLGMEKEYITEQLKDRFYSGDAVFDKNKGLVLVQTRGLWIDIQHGERWLEKNGEAYYRIIGLMMEQEFTPLMEEDADTRAQIGKMGMARIIPRYDSVKDHPELLPVENYKEILKSKKILSQNKCACRLRYPDEGRPENMLACYCADGAAEMAIDIKMGKEISWEDAFDYVQKVGLKEPLIHMGKHTDRIDDTGGILCNCHAQTCGVMRNTVTNGGEHKVWDYYNKSRFRAVIDPEKCINCGLCAKKRCMFDAIKLVYNRDVGEEKYWVNEVTCMGCGCCVETCPQDAMKMVLVDPPEVLKGFKVDTDTKDKADKEKSVGAFPYNI